MRYWNIIYPFDPTLDEPSVCSDSAHLIALTRNQFLLAQLTHTHIHIYTRIRTKPRIARGLIYLPWLECILGADARPFQLDSYGSRPRTGTRGGSWKDHERGNALRRSYLSQRCTVRRKGTFSLRRAGTARLLDPFAALALLIRDEDIIYARWKSRTYFFSSARQIQRSHGVMYIPFDGKEIPYREYEVLVQCWISYLRSRLQIYRNEILLLKTIKIVKQWISLLIAENILSVKIIKGLKRFIFVFTEDRYVQSKHSIQYMYIVISYIFFYLFVCVICIFSRNETLIKNCASSAS